MEDNTRIIETEITAEDIEIYESYEEYWRYL